MKRARDNLRAAFPEKSDAEIEAIIKEMCDNLGRTVAEYAHLDKLSLKGAIRASSWWATRSSKRADRIGQRRDVHLRPFRQLGDDAADGAPDRARWRRPSIARVNNPYIDRWMATTAHQIRAQGIDRQGRAGHAAHLHAAARAASASSFSSIRRRMKDCPRRSSAAIAMTTPAPAALALKLGAVAAARVATSGSAARAFA